MGEIVQMHPCKLLHSGSDWMLHPEASWGVYWWKRGEKCCSNSLKLAWSNPVMVMSASSCPPLNRCIKVDHDDNISDHLRIFPLLLWVACLDKTLWKRCLSFDKAKKKVLMESSSSQKLDNKVLEPVSKSDTRSSILVDWWGSYLKTSYVKVLSNEIYFKWWADVWFFKILNSCT